MSDIFFTSDQHFNHANVIKYCDRSYETVEKMDRDLINQWNNTIGEKDIVYHLGDFTLGNAKIAGKYFYQLNGNIFILNNPYHHDNRWIGGKFYSKTSEVRYLPSFFIIKEFNPEIVLFHYPIAQWDKKHYGSWHLHGHSHGNYSAPDGFILDVGVDNIFKLFGQYRPISFEEVKKYMEGLKGE